MNLPNLNLIFNGFFVCAGVLSKGLNALEKYSLPTRAPKRQRKNSPFIVHNLTFGGRGIFITGKRTLKNLRAQTCLIILLTVILMIIILLGFTVVLTQLQFNATSGFPGEGPSGKNKAWSTKESNLKMATWNTRSLTFERFFYCKSLNYDVLAVTELWRTAHKFVDGTTRWTHSKAKQDKSGKPIYPDDKPAGVGILLSERAQAKYLNHGSPCERITWVRLKGPVVNLFIIAIYVPHRARTNPAQHNTLDELEQLLKQVHHNDCIIVLGDINEQLPANIDNHTGNWAYGDASQNADNIIDILRLYDLFAINTKFKPASTSSNATYIAVTKKGNKDTKDVDLCGRQTRKIIRGEEIKGKIYARNQKDGTTSWLTKYPDGHVETHTENELSDMLIPTPTIFTFHQIDYVLVSNRWKSSVTNAKVRWAPSIHRNRNGKTKNKHGKADHALVEITWKWRLRAVAQRPARDWNALKDPKIARAFQSKVHLIAKSQPQTQDTEQIFTQLCSNILTAAKATLPDKTYVPSKARGVSERTKLLFEKRSEATAQNTTPTQLKEIQQDIKKSCLQDYTDWIDVNVREMEAVNAVGDTRKLSIYV